jgi:hypothetical protein
MMQVPLPQQRVSSCSAEFMTHSKKMTGMIGQAEFS